MVRFIFVLVGMIGVGIALLPHIVYLLLKVVEVILRLFHQHPFSVHYRPFGLTAAGLVVIWVVLFTWGNLFGRYFHEVKTVEIPIRDLPQSFDGYRIVQISDLHLDGWMGHEEGLREIISEINSLDADAVVFTGDLVSLSKDELVPFVPVLKELKAKDGVFSIMGNHDYQPYNRGIDERTRAKNVAELQRMEREDLGWHLLLNENVILRSGVGDSIALLGCENHSMGVHNIVVRGDLHKALSGTEGMTRILLTHDPTHWRGEVIPFAENNPDDFIALTLSGHTHSGQFRLFGLSVAAFVYDEYDGLYTEGDQSLYVNIGLGGTMPMRVGATPEVTLIKLRTNK